jgi:hypothetical protein
MLTVISTVPLSEVSPSAIPVEHPVISEANTRVFTMNFFTFSAFFPQLPAADSGTPRDAFGGNKADVVHFCGEKGTAMQ